MGKWYAAALVAIALIFGMGYYERQFANAQKENEALMLQINQLNDRAEDAAERERKLALQLSILEQSYDSVYLDAAKLATLSTSLVNAYNEQASTINELNSRLEARILNLSEYEFDVACSITMGEAGSESDRGIMLLAQALIDGCIKNGVTPSQLRTLYQYQGYNTNYTERVAAAVDAVFNKGYRAIDDTLLYMYNPFMTTSAWHESQTFVTKEGDVRYFK